MPALTCLVSVTTRTRVARLNFTIDAHTIDLYKLSQRLVKITYGIKTILHLAFNMGPRIYFTLIKLKIGQAQIKSNK